MSTSPIHALTMARYNRWQNRAIYTACGALGEEARQRDMGAFFRSIHGTLSHLFWGDSFWMHRFAEWDKPAGSIADSPGLVPDWATLCTLRAAFDDRLVTWTEGLDAGWLADDLVWFSRGLNRTMRQPRWLAMTHFFNHQTHHRGQVTAMITALGGKTEDTDLVLMPGV